MKPVDQTEFPIRRPDGTVEKRGDCLMACVASILEVPLASLPAMTNAHDDGSWWDVLMATLRERGHTVIYDDNTPAFRPSGYHIAGGPSPRGPWGHAVVALDGKVVHDPHPSRAGIEKIERWYLIYPLAQ